MCRAHSRCPTLTSPLMHCPLSWQCLFSICIPRGHLESHMSGTTQCAASRTCIGAACGDGTHSLASYRGPRGEQLPTATHRYSQTHTYSHIPTHTHTYPQISTAAAAGVGSDMLCCCRCDSVGALEPSQVGSTELRTARFNLLHRQFGKRSTVWTSSCLLGRTMYPVEQTRSACHRTVSTVVCFMRPPSCMRAE